MPLSPQDALIYLMIVTACSDTQMSASELAQIEELVERLPVFDGYDAQQLPEVANTCVDLINKADDIEAVLETTIAAIPKRLQDTAYALAVEIAAVDLTLRQEELRLLEMIRDHLDLDRLVTAAMETAARARYRHA